MKSTLKQKINEPKELWKTLKFMRLPSKSPSVSSISVKGKNETVFDETKNCFSFKNFFSNLAQNLLSRLPLPLNIFTESKVSFCYENIECKGSNFQFCKT